MSTTPSDSITVTCPGCHGKFRVSHEQQGRRGRCARCGTLVEIPAAPGQSGSEELILVMCHLCDTPLYGTRSQIGTELKCPDCGARTVLRAPRPKRTVIPAALSGEQYELWETYEAPPHGAPKQEGPAPLQVNCWLCDTLMYARLDQVGTEVTCPDCGSRTLVVARPITRTPAPVLVPPGQEYDVLPPVGPLVAPPVIDPEHARRLIEEDEAGRGGSIHDTQRQKNARLKRKLDAFGRPILPRWPTVTGVLPFLASPGVLPRILVLTGGWTLLSLMILYCIAALFAPTTAGAGLGAGAAVIGVFVLGAAVILGTVAFCAAAAAFVTIVVESSEGNDEVTQWPGTAVSDWLTEAIYLIIGLTIAAVPGWAVAHYALRDVPLSYLAIAVGMVVCFPVVFLSQLDLSSPAAVFSFRIFSSLMRCPVTWFVFIVESSLLMAVCVAVPMAAKMFHPAVLILAPPVFLVAMILYARMLGRLAWAIAEATPARDARSAPEE
jgi:predicted Zn finger-like uncharacterized protein